jgi:drug/metabolite transporter (DMT)-like permease
VRAKHVLAGVPPLLSSALQMLTGGLFVLIAGVVAGEVPRFHLTPKTFGALAYLTIFGSVLTYTAYVYALKSLRTSTISLYAYINPVVAVILGWLVLGERMTWVSVLAMIVILGGVAMVQSARAVYSADESRDPARRAA